jgi:hypothetical protein
MKKLFEKSGKWKFQPEKLQENRENLKNPARGWYQIYTFSPEKTIDEEDLRWSLDDANTLVLLFLDIGGYRDKPLDEEALKHIEGLFLYFQKRPMDVILRVAYDREGRGLEHEPARIDTILQHMEQIGALVKKYPDVLFAAQGFFIGSWGEMHHTKFAGANSLNKLAAAWSKTAGGQCFTAVRTPALWRCLHGADSPSETTDKMTIFDDAVFGSPTHLGTFGDKIRQEAGWTAPWSREEELAFIHEIGNHAPIGGEAVWGEDCGELSLFQAAEELEKLQITYLNCVHDARILQQWKAQQWTKKGAWRNSSGYDYIGAHLGYRFCVRRVQTDKSGTVENPKITIEIENTGFGNFYQEAEVWLENEEGNQVFVDTDVREWKSGTATVISCRLLPKQGMWYLCMCRKWDKRPVFFAHAGGSSGKLALGRLI